MNHPEFNLQVAVVSYLRTVHRDVVYCGSMAGHTRLKPQQWIRANKAGYWTGFPDLVIYAARGRYHGLCIELKSERGKTSPDQHATLALLGNAGYYTCVCNTFEKAKLEIDVYFQIK